MLVLSWLWRRRLGGSNNSNDKTMEQAHNVTSTILEDQELVKAAERGCACTSRMHTYRAMISRRSTEY